MRVALHLLLLLALVACARANPIPHGDAGPRIDGASNVDAATTTDAFIAGNDAFIPGHDAFVPPVDAFSPPVDGHVGGTGAYLDRCTAGADCASALCAADRGGTHFCTRRCTSDLQCAHEHVCVTTPTGGVCFPDDTGAPCSVGAPELCALGLCLGGAAGGHCTRACASAAECPAGYACTRAGGSTTKICVDIEEPCSAAADCATGFCTTLGCTAACDTVADCPTRLAGLPAYACDTRLGSTPLCIPPADILGSAPIGASCPATGTNDCRSGACDSSAPTGPMCVQACDAQGGCGPGLGCFPLADTTGVTLLCERAGTGDLTEPCSTARDCRSGICHPDHHCTRLCADGFCPSTYTCETVAGFGVALCTHG